MKLPREAVGSPSLETQETQLDTALRNTMSFKNLALLRAERSGQIFFYSKAVWNNHILCAHLSAK